MAILQVGGRAGSSGPRLAPPQSRGLHAAGKSPAPGNTTAQVQISTLSFPVRDLEPRSPGGQRGWPRLPSKAVVSTWPCLEYLLPCWAHADTYPDPVSWGLSLLPFLDLPRAHLHPCPACCSLTPHFIFPSGEGEPRLTQLHVAAAAGAASGTAACGAGRQAPAPAPWQRRGALGALPSCTGPAGEWGSEVGVAGVVGGLAGGLGVGAGAPGGRALPRGTGSQG